MTMPAQPSTDPGPYASSADLYWRAGWRGILPLPVQRKTFPPPGYTGAGGQMPSYPDIQAWVTGREGAGNVGLRLPRNVVGIDVDNYGTKPGGETLALAEAAHGPLPPTWRTTSRDDGISGIRLYRVPEGLAWPGEIGPAIEIIHYGYRYAVAWPSIHPEGRVYRWVTPEGVISTTLPDPDQLPALPQAWVDAYTSGELAVTPRADIKMQDAIAWLATTKSATSEPCSRMTGTIDQFIDALPGSAHNAARNATLSIARLAEEGHHGGIVALADVRKRFIADATDPNRTLTGLNRRTQEQAVYEFGDLIASAVGVVHASPSTVQTCDCYGQITGMIVDAATANTEPVEPEPVERAPEPASRLKPGGDFILDAPDSVPSIWGAGDECLWAAGEALMLCGPPGVGKTTVAGQVLRGRLGLLDEVLGLPIQPTSSRVLYLAMDRPAQIARSLRRGFVEAERQILNDKLSFWEGPPPQDVAKRPEVMLSLAELAEADTIIIDSVKDAAVGLTEDEIGAGYNRARQLCLASGIEVLELHHMVKRGANGSKPTELADVYGSAWLTAGAGSVVLLWGAAGDPIVYLTHLKQPAGEVGPWKLQHDHGRAETKLFHGSDLMEMVALSGPDGVTARQAAAAMFEKDEPSENDVEKARRKLAGLVRDERLEQFNTGDSRGTKRYRLRTESDPTIDPTHPTIRDFASGEPNPTLTPRDPTLEDKTAGQDPTADPTHPTPPEVAPDPTDAPPYEIGGADGEAADQADCNQCGQRRPVAIIEAGRGYCPPCAKARGVWS